MLKNGLVEAELKKGGTKEKIGQALCMVNRKEVGQKGSFSNCGASETRVTRFKSVDSDRGVVASTF